MTYLEAMERRDSVRTYQGVSLTEESADLISKIVERTPSGPHGTKPRFVVVRADAGDAAGAKVGTYGVIRGATAYLAPIIVDEGDGTLIDLGYATEAAILDLEREGFGSCWLGGTFRKDRFAAAAGVAEGELLRAVIAFGRRADSRSFVDSLFYRGAGSANRFPLEKIVAGPGALEVDSPMGKLLEALRWAPSASNKQPWRLVLSSPEGEGVSRAIDLFLQRTRGYDEGAGYHIQSIDAGIAACHLEFAARDLGFNLVRRTSPIRGAESVFPSAAFVLGWDLEEKGTV